MEVRCIRLVRRRLKPDLGWRDLRGGLCAAASYLAGLDFGLTEISMACYTRETISEVAREATRYAMAHGSTCQTGSQACCAITAAASTAMWPRKVGPPSVAAQCPSIPNSPT